MYHVASSKQFDRPFSAVLLLAAALSDCCCNNLHYGCALDRSAFRKHHFLILSSLSAVSLLAAALSDCCCSICTLDARVPHYQQYFFWRLRCPIVAAAFAHWMRAFLIISSISFGGCVPHYQQYFFW